MPGDFRYVYRYPLHCICNALAVRTQLMRPDLRLIQELNRGADLAEFHFAVASGLDTLPKPHHWAGYRLHSESTGHFELTGGAAEEDIAESRRILEDAQRVERAYGLAPHNRLATRYVASWTLEAKFRRFLADPSARYSLTDWSAFLRIANWRCEPYLLLREAMVPSCWIAPGWTRKTLRKYLIRDAGRRWGVPLNGHLYPAARRPEARANPSLRSTRPSRGAILPRESRP